MKKLFIIASRFLCVFILWFSSCSKEVEDLNNSPDLENQIEEEIDSIV